MTDDVKDNDPLWTKNNILKATFRTIAAELRERGMVIGAQIDGEGIFLGRYRPRNSRGGKNFCGTFNIFAAPADLSGIGSYADTVKSVSRLKNWYGHNGENYADDKEFFQALTQGSYRGGWIMPPRDLLTGKEGTNDEINPYNLQAQHDKGALKGTFKNAAENHSGDSLFYWSSTPFYAGIGLYAYAANFIKGAEAGINKNLRLSCRPVRLVKIAP